MPAFALIFGGVIAIGLGDHLWEEDHKGLATFVWVTGFVFVVYMLYLIGEVL